jgi:hypothetical protein
LDRPDLAQPRKKAKPCPEVVVGAIIEIRHTYGDGTLSPWKQGVVKEIGAADVKVDVIHCNGMNESVIACKPYIRNAKMLVRSIDHHAEFHHLKGKSYGQLFSSTSVVSPECLVTFGGRLGGRTTLVMSIGFETNIVGGSAHNLGSGMQPQKNLIQDHEIQDYLDRMRVEYVMEDYAPKKSQRCRSTHTSRDQLELMTQLLEDWAPCGKPLPTHHNEVLTNLHADMILGVLSNDPTDAHVSTVCKDFAEKFGRELKVISIQGDLFVVKQR